MINYAIPLIAGNAVRLALTPPDGATAIRVLRNTTGTFAGFDDPASTQIYEGPSLNVLDITVNNGTAYFYKGYALVGSSYVDDGAEPLTVTPNAAYVYDGPDVKAILLDRLKKGFAQELQRGLLLIKAQPGYSAASVNVLSAPPLLDEKKWPIVSVHLNVATADDRAVGEEIIGDSQLDSEGWLESDVLSVIAWSQNPDERHALMRSIRRILQANLAVFDAMGLVQFSLRCETQDMLSGEYPAPVYCAAFTINCKAPAFIAADKAGETVLNITVVAHIASGTGVGLDVTTYTDTAAP